MVAEDMWWGKSKLNLNSAQLELELGLSLAKRRSTQVCTLEIVVPCEKVSISELQLSM